MSRWGFFCPFLSFSHSLCLTEKLYGNFQKTLRCGVTVVRRCRLPKQVIGSLRMAYLTARIGGYRLSRHFVPGYPLCVPKGTPHCRFACRRTSELQNLIARLCRFACRSHRLCRLPKQELQNLITSSLGFAACLSKNFITSEPHNLRTS